MCSRLEDLLPCFAGLTSHVACNTKAWDAFLNSQNPWEFCFGGEEETPTSAGDAVPKPAGSSFTFNGLSRFQKFLLIKTLCRRQHLIVLVRKFIEMELGAEFVSKPPLDLGEAFKESSPARPVFIILGPGKQALPVLHV